MFTYGLLGSRKDLQQYYIMEKYVSCSFRKVAVLLVLGVLSIGFFINTEYILQWTTARRSTPAFKYEKILIQEIPVGFKREIAKKLLEITTELKAYKINPHIHLKLTGVIEQLDPGYKNSALEFPTTKNNRTMETDADTCGEVYKGRRFGYPLYQTGFVQNPNCSEEKKNASISDLVTVVLISNGQHMQRILEGIKDYHENLQVILTSVHHDEALKAAKHFKNVLVIKSEKRDFRTPGKIWNNLASKAKTRYILIARDLSHFTKYARLERLVYLLGNSSSVGVSAGATRNLTGHWKMGCHQTEIKNYFLRFLEGYSHSMKDCVLCDHISGPFMVKTRLLKQVPFSDSLHAEVVFEDWFLNVKDYNILVANCPDVMFFTQGYSDDVSLKTDVRSSWFGLANNWRVTRIFIPPGTQYIFTCKELGFNCDPWQWAKHYLIPTCCLQEVSTTLRELHEFANEVGMKYELDSGSLLAAVKLQGHAPWDLDGDIRYDEKYFDSFNKNRERFSKNNIRLQTANNTRKFKIFTPHIYIEMWDVNYTSDEFLPEDIRHLPTLMNVLGVWVRGTANPGLYARNKYGPNHFKHALFYLYSEIGEWDQYKSAGSWQPCPKSKDHACLDHYMPDGNLHLTPHYFENLGLSWDRI